MKVSEPAPRFPVTSAATFFQDAREHFYASLRVASYQREWTAEPGGARAWRWIGPRDPFPGRT